MGWAGQNSLTHATHETSRPRAIARFSSANAIVDRPECEFHAAASLSNKNRLRPEPDRGDKREDNEQGQYHELSEFKWRLALCRCHRFKHGDFFEWLARYRQKH